VSISTPEHCPSASSTTREPFVRQKTITANPDAFLQAVAPFRDGLAVACECLLAWYWLADLCEQENIPFVLGHALYMKAIHGGKAKTDKIDAHKIAVLLSLCQSGNLEIDGLRSDVL